MLEPALLFLELGNLFHYLSVNSGRCIIEYLGDINTGNCLNILWGYGAAVTGLAVTTDSNHIISASRDGTIKIWDIRSVQELDTLRGHQKGMHPSEAVVGRKAPSFYR